MKISLKKPVYEEDSRYVIAYAECGDKCGTGCGASCGGTCGYKD